KAEAANGRRSSDLRERRACQRASPTPVDRRVHAHGLPRDPRRWQAPLQRGNRQDRLEADRRQDHERSSRPTDLPAERAAGRLRPCTATPVGTQSPPNGDYTRTWSSSGEIEYAPVSDGTRLRYLKTGSGPALILLHTVRTQLDHFQFVIPRISDTFTVYAIDMPGMGWSDISPGASYTEPALRRAVIAFVNALGLTDATLAGE